MLDLTVTLCGRARSADPNAMYSRHRLSLVPVAPTVMLGKQPMLDSSLNACAIGAGVISIVSPGPVSDVDSVTTCLTPRNRPAGRGSTATLAERQNTTNLARLLPHFRHRAQHVLNLPLDK